MTETVNINGLEIGPSTDLGPLLRSTFLGGSALAGRYDDEPSAGVRSLLELSRDTALERRILNTVLGLITDPDVIVRSGAVRIVEQFAEKFDPSDLLRIVETKPDLYQGISGPGSGDSPDLYWALLRAIAARPTSDPRVAARLRTAVLDPVHGGWVLAAMTSDDPKWIVEHAQEVIVEDPVRARIILFRLSDPQMREQFVRAIPRESPELRKKVAVALSEAVKDEAERDHLLKLLR